MRTNPKDEKARIKCDVRWAKDVSVKNLKEVTLEQALLTFFE